MIVTAVLVVAAIAMAVVGGMAAAQAAENQGKAAAQAKRYQAQVSRNNQLIRERNAEMERKIGEYNTWVTKRKQAYRRGGHMARIAKMGLLNGTGDDLLAAQDHESSREIEEIKFKSLIAERRELIGAQDAQSQAVLHDYGAETAKMRAEQEKTSAYIEMGSSIVSTLSSSSSSFSSGGGGFSGGGGSGGGTF